MPDFSQPANPFSDSIEAEVAPVLAPLPGGLKAVCIIAMVLGGIGSLLALKDFVTLAIGQERMSKIGMPDQAGDEQAVQLQREIAAKSAEIQKDFASFLWPAAGAHLLTGLLLVAGGIMTLRANTTGRQILLAGCGLAMVYEIGQIILSAAVWLRLAPVISTTVEEAAARGAQGDVPPDMPSWMSTVILLVPLVVMVIPFLVKFIFYIISLFYLRKATVVAHFR